MPRRGPPKTVKCAVCLEPKHRTKIAKCDRCNDGVVCYDCTSRCKVQMCDNAACSLVHMICPVCKSKGMVFDATATAVSKAMVLRIAGTSLAQHAEDLAEIDAKLAEVTGAIDEYLAANPAAKVVMQQYLPYRIQ